ncbi:epsin-2 isoform X4 [Anas acuta]|uniref:Epsin 2 n=2 Tax=Anatinae TaxID=2068716 RepID=A0A493THB5_ANAPP|nr:epsin-2 isoform X4 [Anas platyrhynchos]XP_040431052.1 epsin-2 isoform X3 [Cygnus olor]XP_040431053.1 epsin-2 isoform X3 [Cygnus olor]XP_047918036.1 epsin-2 isoform X3 [Anser cygnoides]XP_050569766.1 epsin-2 isoform X3 [Cygnus atratus]XP_050569767.1 epsin-2 isoform X3 [Cygnus atratus]|eukprot:XP_027325060.1 epsin-2 isoform X4 [Anas platyrhynchos]
MTTSSIRRQMKNIVNNYSEAEIKVREATSNDPWGPSSSLMTEIADLTYNVVAFSEIMSMIWKRLNDHGKNWRHVYKALTLLDYLIKTGSERVAQQCKENIFAIQTLKDFQYIDRDGKDQGINVREKSKQLVSLLKDDERLKTERAQALKTKERMAQVATGVGSNQITFGRGSSQPNLSTSYSEQEYGKSGGSPASYHGSTSPRVSSELEQARPQTSGEEELQLQLALAMSREVAEQHTTLLDLMDALPSSAPAPQKTEPWGPPAVANQTDPWGGSTAAATASDPWQSFGAKPAASVDPWAAPAGSATQSLSKNVDPWAPAQPSSTAAKSSVDPWGPAPANKPLSTSGSTSFDLFSNLNGTVKDDFSEFDTLRTSKKPAESGSTLPSQHSGTTSPDLFDSQHSSMTSGKQSAARKTPESFLGPNAALVNLDSLVSKPPQPVTSLNPFLAPGAATAPTPINPFQVNQPQPLTLNQMRASPVMGTSPSFSAVPPISMEPIPLSSMAPVPVGMAPIPAMGTVASLTRMGQGLNVSIAGSMTQPLHSTGIPPSASQSTNTTNPFLL